jgi:hypothetical protein
LPTKGARHSTKARDRRLAQSMMVKAIMMVMVIMMMVVMKMMRFCSKYCDGFL